jgi:hypothetical protein
MNSISAAKIATAFAIVVAVGGAGLVPEVSAQPSQGSNERIVRRLGGTTRFSAPVRTVAQLRTMVEANRRDITNVLFDAGLSDIGSQVLDTIASGAVSETTVPSGTRLEWMALKRKGKAEILRNVRWGGAQPFEAFRFTVTTATAIYSFVVPKTCGNISLMSTEPVTPRPAPAPPTPPPPPPTPTPQPAPVTPPPPPTPPPPAVAPPVQPPAAAPLVRGFSPFILGAFGKQRRALEGDAGVALGTFCDPLLGIKGGVEFNVKPNFVIAPAAGVAINLDESDRTSIFAEAEFNRLFDGGGFVGAGIGVWDLNHSDNVVPSLLIHGGAPITRYPDNRSRLLFVGEGRFFLGDPIDDNYQFWAGVRYVFR